MCVLWGCWLSSTIRIWLSCKKKKKCRQILWLKDMSKSDIKDDHTYNLMRIEALNRVFFWYLRIDGTARNSLFYFILLKCFFVFTKNFCNNPDKVLWLCARFRSWWKNRLPQFLNVYKKIIELSELKES